MVVGSLPIILMLFIGLAVGNAAATTLGMDIPHVEAEIYEPETNVQALESRRTDERILRLQANGSGNYFLILEALDVAGSVSNQIGVSRRIEQLEDGGKTLAKLDWQPVGDGGHAVGLYITSPDAKAMRLGIRVERMPQQAQLQFFRGNAADIVMVSGMTINESIERNLQAGDAEADARLYWSPVIEGETVGMEIYLPAGTETRELQIAIPMISHIYQWQVHKKEEMILQFNPIPGGSLACENDFPCYSGSEAAGGAVAFMVYSKAGNSYTCTGNLMNDKDTTTFIPYLLSADHCFTTQSAASSLETFWFYQNQTCDVASPAWAKLGGGATLLYATKHTDTNFMRLNAAPPAGVTFAGWSAAIPSIGSNITGIHHPRGDVKKISFGSVIEYLACEPGGDVQVCLPALVQDATSFGVRWSSGLTEGGSSGSGLLLGTEEYIVGTLSSGTPPTCAAANWSTYGLFGIPYTRSLHQWLFSDPGANTCGHATALISERTYQTFEYERCEGVQSVTAMTNVRIASGADVLYEAPVVGLDNGFSVDSGGRFHVVQ